jgi:hypothetical protein
MTKLGSVLTVRPCQRFFQGVLMINGLDTRLPAPLSFGNSIKSRDRPRLYGSITVRELVPEIARKVEEAHGGFTRSDQRAAFMASQGWYVVFKIGQPVKNSNVKGHRRKDLREDGLAFRKHVECLRLAYHNKGSRVYYPSGQVIPVFSAFFPDFQAPSHWSVTILNAFENTPIFLFTFVQASILTAFSLFCCHDEACLSSRYSTPLLQPDYFAS